MLARASGGGYDKAPASRGWSLADPRILALVPKLPPLDPLCHDSFVMHYVPDSARDFLPDDAAHRSGSVDGRSATSFHYQSAPVYFLTLLVGSLLAADLLIGLFADPAWAAYRSPFGFRLALLAAVLGGGRILYQTLDGL